MKRLSFLLILTLALPAAFAQQIKLRVMGTTDVHMHLLAYDYYQDKPVQEYGLARTATLIKAARAEQPNNLLFDNGDLLQGNPLGDYVARIKPLQPGQVHPAFKVMKALGYDAANVGNHEFNYGLPFLRAALATAAFPYVSANVLQDSGPDKGQPAFKPYVILERRFKDEAGQEQRLKVGVIGFVPPQIMQWDRANLAGRVAPRDIPQTARELVPRMRAEGADVVVVLAHSGFEFGETVFFAENTVARLAEVPGVSAIVFGHSHGEFPGRFFNRHPKVDLERGTINGVPAVMAGFWGSHLGVIDLVLDKGASGWPGLRRLRVACATRRRRCGLLEFDGRASGFELLLELFGFGLVDAFLDRLRRRFDQRLGFGQAQAGDGADFLDDVDLLATVAGQDDVEFGLFFSGGSSSSGRASNGDGSSGRNAPLFFEHLGQVSGFENGQCRQLVDDCIEVSHVIFSSSNVRVMAEIGRNVTQRPWWHRPEHPGQLASGRIGQLGELGCRGIDETDDLGTQLVERRQRRPGP